MIEEDTREVTAHDAGYFERCGYCLPVQRAWLALWRQTFQHIRVPAR
jgi:hypothetical protein